MTNFNRSEQILNAVAFILDSRKESEISRLQLETLDDESIAEFGEDSDFGPEDFSEALGIIIEASKVW